MLVKREINQICTSSVAPLKSKNRRMIAFAIGSIFLGGIVELSVLDTAFGQKPDISGSIELENEPVQRTPYDAGQEEAIALFESLLVESEMGKFTHHSLGSKALKHLAGTYLYCSTKQATCPVILEGLLEADIATASIKNTPACPMLEQFWMFYEKSEFNKREGFLHSVGHASAVATFTREQLPRYKNCTETVAKALREEKTARQASSKKAFANTAYLLNQFKKKIPNVFSVLGIEDSPQLPD
jgi:hypothetical protein